MDLLFKVKNELGLFKTDKNLGNLLPEDVPHSKCEKFFRKKADNKDQKLRPDKEKE